MKLTKLLFTLFTFFIFVNSAFSWSFSVSGVSEYQCYPSNFYANGNSCTFNVTVDVDRIPIIETPYYYAYFFIVQNGIEYQVTWRSIGSETDTNLIIHVPLELNSSLQSPFCFNNDAILKIKVFPANGGGSIQTQQRYFRVYKPAGGGTHSTGCTPDVKVLNNFQGGEIQYLGVFGINWQANGCGGSIAPTTAYAKKYKISKTISKNSNEYVEAVMPLSLGFSGGTLNDQRYWSYVESQNSTSVTLITFVYQRQESNNTNWWPCTPENAVIAYRVLNAVPPTVQSVTSSGIDNIIYRGETKRFYCNASGTISSYEWARKYCGRSSACNIVPQGLSFGQQSNYFDIKNINYTGVICDGFCGLTDSEGKGLEEAQSEEEISLIFNVRACNQFGCSSSLVYPTGIYNISFGKTLRPPTNGGCPYIVTFKDGITDYENNILHRNDMLSFGNDLDDYIIIKNDIAETDSTLSLYIKETDDDFNYYDQMKMYAYDVPAGCKLVISENNQFYLLDTTLMVSPSTAMLNQSTDITQSVQYNTVSENVLEGVEQDVIDAEFNSGDIKGLTSTFYSTFLDSINAGLVDSLALIIQMERNPHITPIVKSDAASITITTESGRQNYTIFRREGLEYVVLPFSTRDNKIQSLSMTMSRDYSIKFIGVTGILNITEGITELPLVGAEHSAPGLEGLPNSLIADQDDNYLTLDSSQHLKLTYTSFSSAVSLDYTRKYIFYVNGHYTGIQGRPVQADNKDKREPNYELLGNKPNPFNPTTTIAFKLAKDSFVKIKVYNLLGQLISTLSDGMQKAGYNEVRFDGTNLSSGIYFYDFQVEGAREIRRMVLIK